MSAGPFHYREAERLIWIADGLPGHEVTEKGLMFQEAQVHATLAQAAAAAEDHARRSVGSEHSIDVAWSEAIS